jgi:hypothetical protein
VIEVLLTNFDIGPVEAFDKLLMISQSIINVHKILRPKKLRIKKQRVLMTTKVTVYQLVLTSPNGPNGAPVLVPVEVVLEKELDIVTMEWLNNVPNGPGKRTKLTMLR